MAESSSRDTLTIASVRRDNDGQVHGDARQKSNGQLETPKISSKSA
jgi:hypothetical protein